MEPDANLAADAMLPVLLRPGRGGYGLFIRDALTAAGFTDMPPNGGYVLGLIEPDGLALADVISDIGVSSHNARELVDMLVVRGYVDRTVDRSGVFLTLTERGRAASAAVLAAALAVDARLLALVGAERLQHTKETLAALLTLRTSAPRS
jgi:DNA-binding MarR family transcriptional regulator